MPPAVTRLCGVPAGLGVGRQIPTAQTIVTPEELAAAAAEVPVKRLDLAPPEVKDPMDSNTLSERFFNQPEEMLYGGVTSTDWRKKWDLFAKALVKKASKNKLDANGLKKCLRALNHGRTKQTMYCVDLVAPVRSLLPPDASPEKIKADEIARAAEEKEAAAKNLEIQKDKEVHPERYYNDDLAILPCGAYLAKFPKGNCWIIVCHWDYIIAEKQLAKLPPEKALAALGMAHIMIWAMDAKTAEVIAYETCD